MCDSKDLLISFLYDELAPRERRAFESHLSSCADCREELAGLRTTRGQIAQWAPPHPELAFSIVRGGATAAAPPRLRISPAWGLAAAALLVMAVSAAIAHVEVRYGNDGLTVRTGWNQERVATTTSSQPDTTSAAVVPAAWKEEIDRLNQRVRQLEAAPAKPSLVQAVATPRAADADLLRRVRALVDESEMRQQRELALRIRQVFQDVEARRRTDLVSIQQGLGQLQGAAVTEAAQHRDLVNSLNYIRASQR